jgi:hypothetical protein
VKGIDIPGLGTATGTRYSVELLIQQRHELTSDIRVSDKAPDLPPVHPANIRDAGLATLLITGVEKSQIASGRRSVGISQ